MTIERFKVHKMIEGQTTAEDIDVDFLKELLVEDRLVDDLTMYIEDTKEGRDLTYRECVTLLNRLYDENQSLKKFIQQKCPLCGFDLAHYYKLWGGLILDE